MSRKKWQLDIAGHIALGNWLKDMRQMLWKMPVSRLPKSSNLARFISQVDERLFRLEYEFEQVLFQMVPQGHDERLDPRSLIMRVYAGDNVRIVHSDDPAATKKYDVFTGWEAVPVPNDRAEDNE